MEGSSDAHTMGGSYGNKQDGKYGGQGSNAPDPGDLLGSQGIAGIQSNQNYQQSIPVPGYKMGWIIGKRGSYVKQLQKKSGAQISVSNTTSKEYGTVWKYIQISGNGRAIDRAKKLLHIRLERLQLDTEEEELDDDGDGGGGEGEGGGGGGEVEGDPSVSLKESGDGDKLTA